MIKVLYTGSFDPITKGHMNIVKQASENTVINNVIYEGINLNSQEQGRFVIKAKVQHIEEAKVTRNTASVEVLNVCKDISTEVSHTLTPTYNQQEEETKNIITKTRIT